MTTQLKDQAIRLLWGRMRHRDIATLLGMDLDDARRRARELGMMKTIQVVIIEAGDYTERVDTFDLDTAGTEQEMVDQAMAAVAVRGYRVMADSEGGCCEYVGVSDGEDYIAITVYPDEG